MLEFVQGRNKKSLQRSPACVLLQGPSGYFKVKYEMYPSKSGWMCGCWGLGYMSRSCHAVTDLSPDPSLCSVAPGCCGFDTCRRPRGSAQSCWRSSLPSEPRQWPCGHEEVHRMEESGQTGHSGAFICSTSQTCDRRIKLLPGENIVLLLTNVFCISWVTDGITKYFKAASLTKENRTHQRVLSW